jgi:hypothetical protein
MASATKRNQAEDIERLLKTINQSWLEGRWEDLEDSLHQDMVITAPGLKAGGRGREACIQSYRNFAARAEILDYRESDRAIDVWGDTAVASYRYEMSYRLSDQEHHDTGYDVFVFSRQEGKWRAVWRTIAPAGT